MRAVIRGGFRPIAGLFASETVVGRAVSSFAKKAMTRGREPFCGFLDAYDRFVGIESTQEERS